MESENKKLVGENNEELFYQKINDNLVKVITPGEDEGVSLNIFVLTPKQAKKAEHDCNSAIQQFSASKVSK